MLSLFCAFLCLFVAAAQSDYVVHSVNQPGAAGVPTWFSTVSYVTVSPQLTLLYISGTIATPFPSPKGPPKLVSEFIGPQTQQTLLNIVGAIDWAHNQTYPQQNCDGHDWRRDLVKCRVFLANITAAEQNEFNEVYESFFDGIAPPSRVAFTGAQLIIDAKVEIECDAVLAPCN